MKIRDYATAMAAYGTWMNAKVFASAAELTDEDRKRDLGAFFKSIHGTLNHILLGDRAWLQRFRGEAITMRSADQELFSAFDELWAERQNTDREIDAWARALDDRFADAPYAFFSVTYNKNRVVPGWAVITHLFNHQTHHRGQVTTLLKQLGKDPGVTDLPWMPYFDSSQPD
jgi:uncharacterized damage-inducible protein DinB